MKLNTYILWHFFIAIAIIIVACNPEPLPEPVNEQPEIIVEGQLGGNPFLWEAGEDQFYNFSSSYLNNWNYWEMSSTMKAQNWDSSRPYFAVTMLDHSDFDQSFDPDLRFKESEPQLVREEEWLQSYKFSLEPNFGDLDVFSLEWDIAGTIENDPQPVFRFSQSGSHLVCLKIVTNAYDTIHTCKRVNMSGIKTYQPRLNIIRQTTDSIFVSAQVEHKLCDEWIWDGFNTYHYQHGFDKQNLQQSSVQQLQVMSDGSLVTDLLYQLSDENYDGTYELQMLNFEADRLEVDIVADQHGKIIVDFFDPDNGLYSTRFYKGSNDHLKLLGAEPFEVNENNENTYKVELSGSVILATEFGDELLLDLNQAVLAFPDPQ